jgi:hypothetical protein
MLALQECFGDAGGGASSTLPGEAGALVLPIGSDSVCAGTWLRSEDADSTRMPNRGPLL